MKIAQELRAGNVVMIGKDPMVVLKAEYSKSEDEVEELAHRCRY